MFRYDLDYSGMMLDHITIQGFKSIRSIERLELRPINIVIGANGSGKSNFLGAFELLRAIRTRSLENFVLAAGGAEHLLHFGSNTTQQIRLALAFAGRSVLDFALLPTEQDSLFLAGQSDWAWIDSLAPSVDYSRLLVYHCPDASPARKMVQIDDNRFLRKDGSNLAAFLYLLRERHPSEYALICKTIQLTAPFFGGFRLEPLLLKPDSVKIEWTHRGRPDDYFDGSALSDGTLRFIILATLFLQPKELKPSVILVDEPELGLHPHAITLLAALIRQASVSTQVIVSTQSPHLLDQFAPEDVIVANRVLGATELARLDPIALKRWLKRYSLGELWDNNELGGRPRAES